MKFALVLLLSLAAACVAWAEDTEKSFTFDMATAGQAQALPSWMTSPPMASPTTHAVIGFPITPPAGNSDLAVTLYFNEIPGGFLRVFWTGTQSNEMLSDNLFEGIAMPNQRTLLIKRAELSSPGVLSIQSSEPALNLSRIHWEWVDPSAIPVADAAKQTAMVDASGKGLTEGEVNGAPQVPKTDQIEQSIVTASLTDKPERIETGVEFVATLQATPQYARIELQISGAPMNKPLQLWLNGNLVGDVSLEVPDLKDLGYTATDGGSLSYVGWRKGAIYLPVDQLKAGDNQFQFGVKDSGTSTTTSPLAIKNLLLQLKYPDVSSGNVFGASDAQAAAPADQVPLPDLVPDPIANPVPHLRLGPVTPP